MTTKNIQDAEQQLSQKEPIVFNKFKAFQIKKVERNQENEKYKEQLHFENIELSKKTAQIEFEKLIQACSNDQERLEIAKDLYYSRHSSSAGSFMLKHKIMTIDHIQSVAGRYYLNELDKHKKFEAQKDLKSEGKENILNSDRRNTLER